MNKEIFTTADMNEIVTPIHKSMEAGNPVAKLVFDINEAINALKPGRPISKAERDNLELMWDNLLVGMANETMGVAESVFSDDNNKNSSYHAGCFEAVLCDWYNTLIMKREATKKEAVPEFKLGSSEKLHILELINSLATIGMTADDIADLFRTTEEIIIGVIKRDEKAEEALFEGLSAIGALAGMAAGENLLSVYSTATDNDEDDEGKDNSCCSKCNSCNELSDEEFESVVKRVYSILKDADDEKKAQEKRPLGDSYTVKFPGGYYKKTSIKCDGSYDLDDIIKKITSLF